MKIVCDSCSTKYSISDDKVRGKVFKIRCKKCSHIIVVRGTGDGAAAAADASAELGWHLVVDGEQVGPLSDAEVRARLARGEVTGENYVWREGFSDWLRLATVPEFADVVPASPAPGGGELFRDAGAPAPGSVDVPAADFTAESAPFAAAPEGVAAVPSGRTTAGRSRISGAHAAVGGESASPSTGSMGYGAGADLFGAAVPAAHVDSGRVRGGTNGTASGRHENGRHDGGRIENLTAQRSENSVLFSLSNLQSLALGSTAAKPAQAPSTSTTTEGSGLIDIRAMAASTLRGPGAEAGPMGTSQANDLPAFGSLGSAAPVLLPIPSASGPPKWIYLLIVIAAGLVVAVGAAAFSILRRPVVVEQPIPPAPPPQAAPAPTPAKAGAPVAAGAADSPAGSGEKTAVEGETATKEAAAGAGGGPRASADKAPADKKGARRFKRGGAGVAADTKRGAGSSPAAAGGGAVVEEKKVAKGSLDDLLEGALNRRGAPAKEESSPRRAAPAAAAPEPAGAGPLSKSAVVAGMNGVKGKVSDCYNQFKVPGTAMVNVVIGKSGKVTSATVTGKFAGTPTGACVEKAVRAASFPPSDGLTTPYPFTLR